MWRQDQRSLCKAAPTAQEMPEQILVLWFTTMTGWAGGWADAAGISIPVQLCAPPQPSARVETAHDLWSAPVLPDLLSPLFCAPERRAEPSPGGNAEGGPSSMRTEGTRKAPEGSKRQTLRTGPEVLPAAPFCSVLCGTPWAPERPALQRAPAPQHPTFLHSPNCAVPEYGSSSFQPLHSCSRRETLARHLVWWLH